MNTIRIAESQRDLENATESWITEQIRKRQNDGQSVCVRVTFESTGVDIILSTPECSRTSEGGRKPTEREQEIFDLWDARHLNEEGWTVGNLIAFLKQVRKFKR